MPPFSLTQKWFPEACTGKDYIWKGTRCEDTAEHCAVAENTEDKTLVKILSKTLQVLLSQVFFLTTTDQVLTFFP